MKLHERLTWIRKLQAPATIKAVLWVLADHSDPQGHCFLLQSTIASEAGITDRTVRNVLSKLRRKGVLSQRHTGKYDHFYLNLTLFRQELDSGQVGTTFLHNRPKNPSKPRTEPTIPNSARIRTPKHKWRPSPMQPCGNRHAFGIGCEGCQIEAAKVVHFPGAK